ncbi:MAG: hypothetical protein K9L23_16240 [Desulfotignum sp.]|nr:hypothetical protein [Desulfotignum sp.]MCF8089598.1 hypothetical protein [Desulfotignum sp.]
MKRCSGQAQSLCNPVLGDAKAVHAKYFDVKIHLVHSAKIGDVCIHDPSGPARAFQVTSFRTDQVPVPSWNAFI